MRTILFTIFFVLFSGGNTFSQTTLELPLDPGRISAGADLQQTADGDYLLSSYVPGVVLTDGGDVNLTRFSLREGTRWSKDFLFDIPTNGGYVADWPQEQAVLLTAFLLDATYNKVLVKLDPQGNVLWSRRYGKPGDVSNTGIFNGKTLALPLADGNVLLAGGAYPIYSTLASNDLFLGKIDPDGAIIWARNLCFSCLGNVDAALGNVIVTSDGGYLLAGMVTDNQAPPHGDVLLVKFSAGGDLQWTRTFNSDGSFLPNDERGYKVRELPNGHFVVVGSLENYADDVSDGLILEVDANGDFLRSVAVQITNSDHIVRLLHFETTGDNAIVVTGSTVQDTVINAALQLNFLAQIQLDGTVDWQHHWYTETLTGFGTQDNALLRQPGGGYAYLMNYHETTELLFPILLLTDENGETGCEEGISLTTKTTNIFTAQDLSVTAEPLTFSEEFLPEVQDFEGFDVPLPYPDLGPDRTVCEPLAIELDAATPDVDSYTWSTGENTPAIIATEPGEYTVTVTDDDFCFTTADTVRVEVSVSQPAAAITLDTTGFCENGFALLIGTTENADDRFWSSGETDPFIQATEAGEYTLTVGNDCGEVVALVTLELPVCDTAVAEPCRFMVPNAFSPNGDGINDEFRPLGPCLDVPGYVFKVFSRWGELVFETGSPLEGWTGNFRSKVANSDVYIWFLQYTDGSRGVQMQKGDVRLLR